MLKVEHCRNPWNGKCKSMDIYLYIIYKGAQLPICRRCWNRIAERRIEWGKKAEDHGARGD